MPASKDLTGKKFGQLTVIKKSENKKYGRIAWVCKCDCGNETIVITNHLTSGHTRSCGCLQIKVTEKMNPGIDITNQRFGKLIAIKKVESKNKKTYWLCQCDCGNECIISTNALRSGHTSSCGCITSKGEEKIAMWLQAHDIKFERQKTFDTCRNTKTNALLRFDFFINNNFLLEYDGISHFKSTGGWNTEEMVQNIQNNDKIKNTWALKNNIKLYRISYDSCYSNNQLNNILSDIIKKEISFEEDSAF